MPVHCDTVTWQYIVSVNCDCVTDQTLNSTVAAKRREACPSPAGRVVYKYTAVPNIVPKFGVFVCFDYAIVNSNICY